MSYYQMDYSMTNPGTPGWQFAPVPGWGANPAAAGPARVGMGCPGGCRGGVGEEPRTATDIQGRYSQTSYGVVASVGAGALLLGVFLGYLAGKRAKKRATPNGRLRRNGRRGVTANARWSRKYKNQLPDSAFLYVGPGQKTRTRRGTFTVPRTARKLPYKNLQGRVDRTHLLNAIARLGQSKTRVPHKRQLQQKAQRIYAREFGYAGPRALPRAA